MELSVIIVNYNAAEYLPRCLASLEKHLPPLPYEIVVVDNASTDGSADAVARDFPSVHLIRNPQNVGFSAGINIGLKSATGQFLFWLNPDSELLNAGAAELLEYFREHAEVGILGPQIVDPGGTIQLSCRAFPSYRTAFFNRYSLLTKLFPQNRYSREYLQTEWDHATVRPVDWVSGAGLLHRREVVEKMGGLDERFFMYSEDVDFCLRAQQADWQTYYHPALRVQHHIAGSSRQQARRMIAERHRSMWRYYAKHFQRNPLKDVFVGVVIAMRCGFLTLRHGICGASSRGTKKLPEQLKAEKRSNA